jgi:hypothetical protein
MGHQPPIKFAEVVINFTIWSQELPAGMRRRPVKFRLDSVGGPASEVDPLIYNCWVKESGRQYQ